MPLNDRATNAAQPGRYFEVGKYRQEHQPNGRWGASARARGVANYRTPIGAVLALWAWRRRHKKELSCR